MIHNVHVVLWIQEINEILLDVYKHFSTFIQNEWTYIKISITDYPNKYITCTCIFSIFINSSTDGTLIMIFNFQVYKILSSTKDTCTYILIPMHSSFKPEELKPFFLLCSKCIVHMHRDLIALSNISPLHMSSSEHNVHLGCGPLLSSRPALMERVYLHWSYTF